MEGSTESKIITAAEITGVMLGLFLIFKLFQKMGIFDSDNSKGADALGNSTSLAQDTINELGRIDSKFRPAIKNAIVTKYGYKATPANVLAYVKTVLTPNSGKYEKFVKDIWGSYNRLSSNDVGRINSVFKSLKSQFEVSVFAKFFNDYTTIEAKNAPKSSLVGDLYAALDNLMHNSDMSKLNDLNEAKPLI